MGKRMLEAVGKNNRQMSILGGICDQQQVEKSYRDVLPRYSHQIRGLMGVLESGKKTGEVTLLTPRQRLRREGKLLHMLQLREEVLIFLGSAEKNARK